MKKLVYITGKNLKYGLAAHLIIALLLCLMVPVIFGLNHLDRNMAAIPLERIVILTGILIMVPIFMPEQDRPLFDIMYTKMTPPAYVYAVRAVYSAIVVLLIPAVFTVVMYLLHSAVTLTHYLGTVSSAFFLGSIGALTLAVTNNTAAAYMIPVICYVICLATRSLKMFDVMMMSHGIINGKPYQMAVGILLTVTAVVIASLRKKLF